MMGVEWQPVLVIFVSLFLLCQSFQSSFNVVRQDTRLRLYQVRATRTATAFPSANSTDILTTKRSTIKKKRSKRTTNKRLKTTNKTPEKWRIYDVKVHPDHLMTGNLYQKENATQSIQEQYMHPAVMESLKRRVKHATITSAKVIRRSLDARCSRRKGSSSDSSTWCPMYVYIIDAELVFLSDRTCLREQPGRTERCRETSSEIPTIALDRGSVPINTKAEAAAARIIVVGAGPAGLLCALELILQQKQKRKNNNVQVVLLEQGQPVEQRGRHIGALMHRRVLNPHSNFCFGEGGAGTWSDGKLTTRIGRNAGNVRKVLETLVRYGAPERILVEGSPHLGTDNLVRLLRNMRMALEEMGVDIRFGTKVTGLIMEGSETKGVSWENVDSSEEGTLLGDAVVLASGHSSRETYEQLHKSGVQLETKGFAVGFRVEHPQQLITKIQYGHEWGGSVRTGKALTDKANQEYFSSLHADDTPPHVGKLPVPSYRLATKYASDGTRDRSVYSFCMCPGGQIVPASTDPNEVCVNGMSFSRRDSPFANSALVITVSPDDALLAPYREEHGVLAGIAFQRDMERKAAVMGGGSGLRVPTQRLTDFLDGVPSSKTPPSSYRLGVKASACHELYPEEINESLRNSLLSNIEASMPGFVSDHGILHGVETRTSSPLRIPRNADTLEAIGTKGLFPSGEGAGFAGGIVSAAVDGLHVANAVLRKFELTVETPERDQDSRRAFHY